jgi:hypothetical protein
LESSVRVFSFFREVFVLFSFKFRSSFTPRRVASLASSVRYLFCFLLSLDAYLYNAWQLLRAVVGITVGVAINRVGFDMRFWQKSVFFRFLAWDSIFQPHGEGDFAIHYTIDTQLLGVWRRFFVLYINVATCEH